MRGAISLLPQYVFMAWCLVKHRDNFTFTFFSFVERQEDILNRMVAIILQFEPALKFFVKVIFISSLASQNT
jgi:hypothetical protein